MLTLVEEMNKQPLCDIHEIQNLEEHFFLARPRLSRLARRYGVSPDAVDDVVQETMLYAWQHLEQLYTLDVFERWLDGICRNFCLRWRRASTTNALRETHIDAQSQEDAIEREIADPMLPDPLEELEREDLKALLDRAMGHLPKTARLVLELCYLEEIPQREAALQLGLTTNALEVRLHRARRRLYNVLKEELRDEAESFGLMLNADTKKTLPHWYETRLWCGLCGKRRLRGCFEPMMDGRTNMRLCCPDCSYNGLDLLCTLGMFDIPTQRSFTRALRQIGHDLYQRHSVMIENVCPDCHALGQIYPVAYGEFPETLLRFPPHTLKCHLCGAISCLAVAAYVRESNHVVQDFSTQHPRAFLASQDAVMYDGQGAIRYSLVDVISAAQLTVTVYDRTLQVLALS